MTRNEFLESLNWYGQNNFPEYLVTMSELLRCETEEAAILQLKKYQLSEAAFQNKMERFKKKFPEQIEEIKYLEELYKKYKEKYCVNKEKKENKDELYVDILFKILKSGYTMEEYCAVYGKYTLKHLKRILFNLKHRYPLLVEEFQSKCLQSTETFQIYMKNLVRIMSKIQDFTMFDYYYYTKLNPFDFIEMCKKYLNDEELNVIQPVFSKLRASSGMIYGTVSMRHDLDNVTIIQGRQITRDEKIRIIEYLEADKIPSVAYKAALRKYVAGDERLTSHVNQPQKVKTNIKNS